MDMPEKLLPFLAGKIRDAQSNLLVNEVLFDDPLLPVQKNEYLFFIKPEITRPSKRIRLELVLQLALNQLEKFGFKIHSIRILSADYLKSHNLIDHHYGVISHVSNEGLNALSVGAKERFKEQFGVDAEAVDVLGGMEFLRRFPFFNDHSLDCLWQNFENYRLGSGTYAERLRVDLETVYVLNGFHPRQLKHFTENGRSILLFRISSDLPWKVARTSFIGATVPSKAAEGSLRHLLLERKEEFGIPEVSQSYNGFHLSAGPVEGLVELYRFDSDHSNTVVKNDYKDFSFGKKLIQAFGVIPQAVIDNALLENEGQPVTVFDLTEEVDSEAAIRLLMKVLK